ncbi:MAG: SEC-C domain-containing protein, partial [Pseudomonadota bacterium]|nr:SEC-C domain-containing protein [Pseudomonadota bacterium]
GEIAGLPAPDEATIGKIRGEWAERHERVLGAGGLHIVGTERHESRRIDNQLRGRSGRQGDPGSSRFYLSMEDNLMRIFGDPLRTQRLLKMAGMKEGEVIESGMLTRQIEKAQRKVEQHNFDIRKNLLEFDDTANDQRKVIYEQRNELLDASEVAESIHDIRADVFAELVNRHVPPDSVDEQWDIAGLDRALVTDYGIELDLPAWIETQSDVNHERILRHVLEVAERQYAEKEAALGAENMRQLEKQVMLTVLDNAWKEHLSSMDYLRQGIYLRGYAQKQPKQEFKRESLLLFSGMLDDVKAEVTQILARVRLQSEAEIAAMEAERQEQSRRAALEFQHAEVSGYAAPPAGDAVVEARFGEQAAAVALAAPTTVVRDGPKVGRNDPCPCGSGKKYKHCHGRLG